MTTPSQNLLLGLCLLTTCTAAASGQESFAAGHHIAVSGGVLSRSVRDAGFSPLLYQGAAPGVEAEYARRKVGGHTLLRLDGGNLEAERALSDAVRAELTGVGIELAHLRRLSRLGSGQLTLHAGLGTHAFALYRVQQFPHSGSVEERDDISVLAALRPTMALEHPDFVGGSLSYRAAAPVVGITYHVIPGQPFAAQIVGPNRWRQLEQQIEYARPWSGRWDWSVGYRLDWLHHTPERELEALTHRVALGLLWNSGRRSVR